MKASPILQEAYLLRTKINASSISAIYRLYYAFQQPVYAVCYGVLRLSGYVDGRGKCRNDDVGGRRIVQDAKDENKHVAS